MALPMKKNVEWQYRGEGNCALVIADPQNRKVYRLVKNYFTQRLTHVACQQSFESKRELIDAALRHIVDYVINVMQPMLRSEYVDSPQMTTIEESFVENVQPIVADCRPDRRRSSSQDVLDNVSRSALVLPDVCFVSNTLDMHKSSQECEPTTISIEIKPKKAFLPVSQHHDGVSVVKNQVCKFCMHQSLKVDHRSKDISSWMKLFLVSSVGVDKL